MYTALNKLKILLLLIYSSTDITSQSTRLIVNKFEGTKQISESYSVLKSNRVIKHGDYISYFRATKEDLKDIKMGYQNIEYFIKAKGKYLNGKKDGEWIEYSHPSSLKSQGSYNNDNKIGIWLTSKEGGNVIEKYDYDNHIKLKPIIKVPITYPARAKEDGIQGIVIISYHVNSDCSFYNFNVLQSVSPECDKVALATITKFGELKKKYDIGDNCKEKTDTFRVNFKFVE